MTLLHACWTVYDDYEKLWDYDFYDVKGLCVQKLWPVTFTRVDMHRSSKIILFCVDWGGGGAAGLHPKPFAEPRAASPEP